MSLLQHRVEAILTTWRTRILIFVLAVIAIPALAGPTFGATKHHARRATTHHTQHHRRHRRK
jgi:hypothetical protein